MTLWSTHMSLFLLLHNVVMMLESNKANRAEDKGISMLNVLHETWEVEILCEMGLSFVRRTTLFYVSHVLMMMLDIIWLSLGTSW